jgi:hypothetical protein
MIYENQGLPVRHSRLHETPTSCLAGRRQHLPWRYSSLLPVNICLSVSRVKK